MTGTVGYNVAKARKPDRDRIDMRLDPDIRRRAESQAVRFGETLSSYIRRALIRQTEEDEQSAPAKKPVR
jgi:hypothetical protein